jgi:hypothetical protein
MKDVMTYKEIIRELTETGSYRHALFYNFPGGLRFELSEGGSAFDQVLTALRKSTAICEDGLGQDKIIVHLQRFVFSTRFELRESLRELDIAGVSIPALRSVWVEINEDDDFGEGQWVNCVFEVPTSKLQNLLWCALATDFRRIHPNPHCLIYLVNPENGILIHPYDDRGMDIICRFAAPLKALYEKYNAWLLDYDRPDMDRTFSSE